MSQHNSSGDQPGGVPHDLTPPAPAPVASSPEDPSNPRAAEGIDPTLAVRTMPASAAASGSAATAYQCPMHPEVTSDHPGRCPKCGMNLVPKK